MTWKLSMYIEQEELHFDYIPFEEGIMVLAFIAFIDAVVAFRVL
jgi:hypothetical protein